MQEAEIIANFFKIPIVKRQDVLLGVGDDAAIVSIKPGHSLVVTTDTLIAGRHFPKETLAVDVGYKAAAVNLSDLAAMGAEPCWVLLSLSMPAADRIWLKNFVDGFNSLLKKYRVQLIGGDLTKGELSITCQALGLVPLNKALTRAGAKVGDGIFVSGVLGDAGLGLKQFKPYSTYKNVAAAVKTLLRPIPRIELGLKLREVATAAIDISDGLYHDLNLILSNSKVGAKLWVDKIPLSDDLQELPRIEALELALTAGDDYELCFTVPPEYFDYMKFLGVIQIGEITQRLGLEFIGAKLDLHGYGYEHFP